MASKSKIPDVNAVVRNLYKYRQAYYAGNPEIPDAEFDLIEEELRQQVPQHQYFRKVGVNPDPKASIIQHKSPMLSMNKGKTVEDALQWLKRIGVAPDTILACGPKIDGMSVTCKYDKDGYFNYAASRGNGAEGNLILHPELVADIPPRIPYRDMELELRGELYISQHLHKTEPRASSWVLRNQCAGIFNPTRKEQSPDIKHVSFAAYDIVKTTALLSGPVSYVSMIDYMRQWAPNVVPQIQVTLVPVEGHRLFQDYLDEYLSILRAEWPFETDGLVLTIDDKTKHKEIDKRCGGAVAYHHFNFAIKPPAKNGQTVLLDATWEVSKHGNVVPVGQLDPVEVGGAEFSTVTLNNAETVRTLDLRKGAVIILERANDVIPRLVSIVQNTGSPIMIPTVCPSCGSSLSVIGKHINCGNRQCPGRKIALIDHWMVTNNIKGVGRKTVEDLYNSGAVHTIPDLYTVNVDEVLSFLPGYVAGGSKVIKINAAIQATRGMSEKDMISRIGIPSIGSIMAEKLRLYSVEDVLKFQHNGPYKSEAENRIHEWISEQQNEVLLLSLRRVLGSYVKVSPQIIPKGVSFAITGAFDKPRENIIADLELLGFTYHISVSSKTNVLLKGEGKDLSKSKKAEALGIPILTSVNELRKKFP